MTGNLEIRWRVVEWCRDNCDSHLPWRSRGDPWAVLLAAVLLRKTTVKQVLSVYEEVLRRYPSPQAVLEAGEELVDVLRPLGMENVRARLLKELARALIERHGGRVPCNEEELVELPGVGRYIASEVLTAGCGSPRPLVDRNVVRLLQRAFGVAPRRKRPHEDPAVWELAERLMPRDREEGALFSYGLLDLARKVCRARNPLCGECPLADLCAHRKSRAAPHRR